MCAHGCTSVYVAGRQATGRQCPSLLSLVTWLKTCPGACWFGPWGCDNSCQSAAVETDPAWGRQWLLITLLASLAHRPLYKSSTSTVEPGCSVFLVEGRAVSVTIQLAGSTLTLCQGPEGSWNRRQTFSAIRGERAGIREEECWDFLYPMAGRA